MRRGVARRGGARRCGGLAARLFPRTTPHFPTHRSAPQDHVLSAIKCVWFNRGESEDKRATADRMVAHVREPSNAKFPLLIFPEGTCVNNEYVVQFKKFVFQLGVPIHPIAIK